MQKVRAAQDRNRSYRAVYHIDKKKLVQLADATMEDVTFTDDSGYVIGSDDRAYRPMVEYDTRYADYYVVDTATGERKPLLKKTRGAFGLGGGGFGAAGSAGGGAGGGGSAASPDG